jgi:hypothetical protein
VATAEARDALADLFLAVSRAVARHMHQFRIPLEGKVRNAVIEREKSRDQTTLGTWP